MTSPSSTKAGPKDKTCCTSSSTSFSADVSASFIIEKSPFLSITKSSFVSSSLGVSRYSVPFLSTYPVSLKP